MAGIGGFRRPRKPSHRARGTFVTGMDVRARAPRLLRACVIGSMAALSALASAETPAETGEGDQPSGAAIANPLTGPQPLRPPAPGSAEERDGDWTLPLAIAGGGVIALGLLLRAGL